MEQPRRLNNGNRNDIGTKTVKGATGFSMKIYASHQYRGHSLWWQVKCGTNSTTQTRLLPYIKSSLWCSLRWHSWHFFEAYDRERWYKYLIVMSFETFTKSCTETSTTNQTPEPTPKGVWLFSKHVLVAILWSSNRLTSDSVLIENKHFRFVPLH